MVRRPSFVLWFALAILAFSAPLPATTSDLEAQTQLLRFPDIHHDVVVFSYAGDLWRVSSEGGEAVRLTAHPGKELFPRISPDGRMVAFTGQYDGDEQVYVIPIEGGEPRQLTWYPAQGPLPTRWGYDHQVMGWTPDGSAVLFRSLRYTWALGQGRLFTVSLDGGLPEALPMPTAGAGAFSPDGRRLAYNPIPRDFRTWKRYEGGQAQDLYLFDLDADEATRLTDHVRTERDPMWIGDRVYFTADWTGTLNLYGMDPATGTIEQLTHGSEWDVRWPSAGPGGQIVFERGGELHVLDVTTGVERHVPVTVNDDGLWRRPGRVAAGNLVFDYQLSPNGERALFAARGDIFTAPVEHGPTRNLTRSSASHDKHPRWSPDGWHIAFISDQSGEEQIYLVSQDGSTEPEALTTDHAAMLYAPAWSPDGARLAYSDKEGRLFVLTLEGRQVQQVAHEARGQVTDYAWSPCGGHLAFSLSDPSTFRSLYLFSVSSGETVRVTGEMASEFSPAWDPDGHYLYFLSPRQFAPQLSQIEWNFAGNRMTKIFALALRRDTPHPFPARSDEVATEGEEEDETEGRTADAPRGDDGFLEIHLDGLADRVMRIPVPADNYGNLEARSGHLLYTVSGPGYYGRASHRQPALHIFSMESRQETSLVENIQGFRLSPSGSHVLVQRGGAFHRAPARPGGWDQAAAISTSDLYVHRDPMAEWEQIFHEVWRRFRDFFYVENMHGYDWEALRDQYAELLEHVAHRADLNYLIGEMIGELNVSHAYKQGGDFEVPPRPRVALPGARFEADPVSGRFRIARIFTGHNEESIYRSPLTEVGVNVEEGMYLLAIEGEELTTGDNPYRHLAHRADHPVTFTVNDRPTLEGARDVTFDPITSENDLIYLDWVEANRRYVLERTDGRVGYLHLPNMGAEGIREFIKYFYPQIRKEGLVVDVRYNGGGNVSQMLIERLRRELLATGFARTSETASTYPNQVFIGHMATIINPQSASDGDIFPAMFRQAGLGPLIGERTWGGVIGITNRGPLVDGGSVNVPEFGFNDAQGNWVIEGFGVEPDLEIRQDPGAVVRGEDPQLDRAIAEVWERVLAEPRVLPERPAPPVRTPTDASPGR